MDTHRHHICGVLATTPDLGLSKGFGEDTTIRTGGTPRLERIPEHPRSWISIGELTCCRRWIEEILEEDRDLLQMLVDA